MLSSSTDRLFGLIGFMLFGLIFFVLGYRIVSEFDLMRTEANAGDVRNYLDETSADYVYDGRYRMKVGSSSNTTYMAVPIGNTMTMMPRTSSRSDGPFVSFFEIDDYVLAISEFDDDRVVLDVLSSETVSLGGNKYPYFGELPSEDEREALRSGLLEELDFGERDVLVFDMTNHIER